MNEKYLQLIEDLVEVSRSALHISKKCEVLAVNAAKLYESTANGEQQANHDNCHCFIDGARCVIQETTMKCYGKPCVLNRGKRS